MRPEASLTSDPSGDVAINLGSGVPKKAPVAVEEVSATMGAMNLPLHCSLTVCWASVFLSLASSQDFGPEQALVPEASGARSVFSADLDGDGDMDVISASDFDNMIAWFENLM